MLTTTSGSSGSSFPSGINTSVVKDTSGSNRIQLPAGSLNTYTDATASPGATTVGHIFDTTAAYSTAGGKLMSFRNNTTEEAFIDYLGRGSFGLGETAGSGISLTIKANTAIDGGNCTGFNTMLKMVSSDFWRSDGTWQLGSINTNSVTNPSSLPLTFSTNQIDGASVIAHKFTTQVAYSTSGAKLISVTNFGTEVVAIDYKGKFVFPAAGTADVRGTATLVAGTKTVTTTSIKTGDIILLTINAPGGTLGSLSAPTASISNGTSFVINSSSAVDTSTVNWFIFH